MSSRPSLPGQPPAAAASAHRRAAPVPVRLPTIRFRLAMLVLACVLPAALVSAYLIYDHYRVERALLLGEAVSTARSMVAVVDRDFDTVTTALRTLATSNDIDPADLNEFRRQAVSVHAILPVTAIALVDPASRRQLMNTAAAAGAAVPELANEELIAQVRQSGKPAVSDLHRNRVDGADGYAITIAVPVLRNGVLAYALTAQVLPRTLAGILSDQKVPQNWRVAIVDNHAAIVARNRLIETFLGKKVRQDVIDRMGRKLEDVFQSVTVDSLPVMTIYSRSPKSGWTVMLGIPLATLSANLLHTLESLILATVVLLTIGLGLAWLVGGRIARSMQALIEPATALGTGAPVRIPAVDFKEAAQVAASLVRAAQALNDARRHAASEIVERQAAQEALIAADLRKDEFLATLAHELRNPMAPLVNALEILRLSGGGAPPQNVLDIMERQLKQMVRLVDDLLDVSRITTNKLSIRRDPLLLQDVVGHALETSGPLFEQRRHRLSVRLPEQPAPLDGDATRLAQVFSNLLNNAAKYTPPGGNIALNAALLDGKVRIEVSDNGIGLPAAVLPHVFDIFFQADQSLGRSQAGLGIGLPLARRLVELHGGSIAAASAGAGLGSVFTVELPLAQHAPAPAPAALPPDQPLPVFRILLADDNADHAHTLRTLLQAAGQEVLVCYDGVSALRAADTFLPELAFLDIGMPRLDGYELARRLRADPRLRHCLLVAVTGWGQEKDQQRSKVAGFDQHIVKPLQMAQLDAILRQRGAAMPTPAAGPSLNPGTAA